MNPENSLPMVNLPVPTNHPNSQTPRPPEAGEPGSRNIFLLVLCVIFVLLVIAGSIYLLLVKNYPSAQSRQAGHIATSLGPTATITLSATTPIVSVPAYPATSLELPALYSALKWSAPESGSFLFRNYANEIVERDGYIIKSVESLDYPKDFLANYEQLLEAKGWTQTDIAGGADGEWFGYEKDGRFISFGSNTVSREPLKYQVVIQYSTTE